MNALEPESRYVLGLNHVEEFSGKINGSGDDIWAPCCAAGSVAGGGVAPLCFCALTVSKVLCGPFSGGCISNPEKRFVLAEPEDFIGTVSAKGLFHAAEVLNTEQD